MTNLIAGFISIIFASKGTGLNENTAIAGILIFVSGFFDLFDGALARALRVESPIGVQLDSLADGVSYGIAPGILSYQAYLYKLPEIGLGVNVGMLVATIFPVCTIFRLARFNIGTKKSGFTGLPSPAAGIIIASIPTLPFASILMVGRIEFIIPMFIFIPIYIFVGLLMISRIDYVKLFSEVFKKGKTSTVMALAVVVLLLVFAGMWSVFFCTSLYILIGIINYLVRTDKKRGKNRNRAAPSAGFPVNERLPGKSGFPPA